MKNALSFLKTALALKEIEIPSSLVPQYKAWKSCRDFDLNFFNATGERLGGKTDELALELQQLNEALDEVNTAVREMENLAILKSSLQSIKKVMG